jgi:hypothetical protein
MANTSQPTTNSGFTFQEYDEYRPLSVEHIREEMFHQWSHEATDEEVIKVIDYIEEHAWMFLYDAIASALSPSKRCPECGQRKKGRSHQDTATQSAAPHP